MKKLAMTAAAAAAAFAVATPASAALTIEADPDPCLIGEPDCTFTFESNGVDGAFSESVGLVLPDQGAFEGSLTATFGINPITITRAWLVDSNMNEFDFNLATFGNTLVGDLPTFNAIAGAYTLNISGVAEDSSYSGVLNFSAVPEPGTWALMILGFGAIGFSMRGRKEKARRISVKYA